MYNKTSSFYLCHIADKIYMIPSSLNPRSFGISIISTQTLCVLKGFQGRINLQGYPAPATSMLTVYINNVEPGKKTGAVETYWSTFSYAYTYIRINTNYTNLCLARQNARIKYHYLDLLSSVMERESRERLRDIVVVARGERRTDDRRGQVRRRSVREGDDENCCEK